MSEKLTKLEWEEKVFKHLTETLGLKILPIEKALWWTSVTGMRLTKSGLNRFQQIGIVFYKYNGTIFPWTASITLGLTRMPSPYYLSGKTGGMMSEYEFFIPDEELAMLLVFMDKDLSLFAKGFI
jgi:hypothetical protein